MARSTFTRSELEAVIDFTRHRLSSTAEDSPEHMEYRIQLESLIRLQESPVDHEGVWDFENA